MERVYERCCALDVHKEQVTACVPDQPGERSELRAEFGTMTGDLLGLYRSDLRQEDALEAVGLSEQATSEMQTTAARRLRRRTPASVQLNAT